MAQPKVLVLGAGFGGLSAAHALRQAAGDDLDLLLVDESPTFLMGLRKLWFLDGRTRPGEGERARSALDAAGIPFRQARVEAIDADGSRCRVDGEDVAYDFLIVALGAQPRPDLIPGNPTEDPNLYTVAGARTAGERLAEIEEGRVLIVIAGLPYKCPPAPYEAAFLIDEQLRRTGRRDRVEIEVMTPQPMSLPVAGPAACALVEGRLESRDIQFRPNATVEGIGPGRVSLAGNGTEEAHLVIVVPPHRPPPVVAESGLGGQGGWIPVNPATLATASEGVFAIGDVVAMKTGAGQPFPKAGVFAERHGEVAGRNVAALAVGAEPSQQFDGSGYCFLEMGEGKASMVTGNFLASPPAVSLAEPSDEAMEAKVEFERERLERWFPERSG